jgi:3-methyl-2-oxobutanoate hydroxymethyltransferase
VVLELVPEELATRVTEQLDIPTVGIGGGAGTDAQVLVWTDMAGLTPGKLPKFVKKYLDLRAVLGDAARAYAADVVGGTYPGPEHAFH